MVIAIGGPTGSGKSALAMALARMTGGEIVSCDSMQIYRTLDIGTAKPTPEEQKEVRHWLIDIRDPDGRYSVAEYVKDACSAIEDINSRGKAAIICGGTGLYMSSLLSGISFPEDTSADDELRKTLREEIGQNGTEGLLREVSEADPDYASRLNPNDVKRIIRAVEIIRSGSTPSIQIENSRGTGFPDAVRILVNCSERDILYRRIEQRCDKMAEDGIVAEAEYVYKNRDRFTAASAAIGYKEFFSYFEGRASLDECVSELKKATRHYAKRQLTWFRREPGFRVFNSDLADPDVMASQVLDIAQRRSR